MNTLSEWEEQCLHCEFGLFMRAPLFLVVFTLLRELKCWRLEYKCLLLFPTTVSLIQWDKLLTFKFFLLVFIEIFAFSFIMLYEYLYIYVYIIMLYAYETVYHEVFSHPIITIIWFSCSSVLLLAGLATLQTDDQIFNHKQNCLDLTYRIIIALVCMHGICSAVKCYH